MSERVLCIKIKCKRKFGGPKGSGSNEKGSSQKKGNDRNDRSGKKIVGIFTTALGGGDETTNSRSRLEAGEEQRLVGVGVLEKNHLSGLRTWTYASIGSSAAGMKASSLAV